MTRITFLIDGFNLYHSVRQASIDLSLSGAGTRWLDIWSMCASYLPAIGNSAQIEKIFYFSALAHHRSASDPGTIARHELFIECLVDTGVIPEMGRFKQKSSQCRRCGKQSIAYEEKETDVAIAVKLLEIFVMDVCDTAVLVTGDTDLVPAITTAKRLFPRKNVLLLFPYKRHNQELKKLVTQAFQLKKETYHRHQFADPYICRDGRELFKPLVW